MSAAAAPPWPLPRRAPLEGRWTRLEPLADAHASELFAASASPGAEERFRWLFEEPPRDLADLRAWIARVAPREDPLFFAVVDRATGRCGGRQALMRITPEHGVAEIGSILWGPGIARTRLATEALYLMARHVFDDLGYRRFEWKCHHLNLPSQAAARRFGFRAEGVFRQHMWHKGANRDTVWFAMLDGEWPALRREYERWLARENFEPDGGQRTPLRPI